MHVLMPRGMCWGATSPRAVRPVPCGFRNTDRVAVQEGAARASALRLARCVAGEDAGFAPGQVSRARAAFPGKGGRAPFPASASLGLEGGGELLWGVLRRLGLGLPEKLRFSLARLAVHNRAQASPRPVQPPGRSLTYLPAGSGHVAHLEELVGAAVLVVDAAHHRRGGSRGRVVGRRDLHGVDSGVRRGLRGEVRVAIAPPCPSRRLGPAGQGLGGGSA